MNRPFHHREIGNKSGVISIIQREANNRDMECFFTTKCSSLDFECFYSIPWQQERKKHELHSSHIMHLLPNPTPHYAFPQITFPHLNSLSNFTSSCLTLESLSSRLKRCKPKLTSSGLWYTSCCFLLTSLYNLPSTYYKAERIERIFNTINFSEFR